MAIRISALPDPLAKEIAQDCPKFRWTLPLYYLYERTASSFAIVRARLRAAPLLRVQWT